MAIYVADFGTLETFTSATTGSNSVVADGSTALVFMYSTAGATGATIKLQQSIDSGTVWADVKYSSETPTSSAAKSVAISDPIGLYRAVCTSHTHDVTVKWRFARRR
jgi:hypothetical protein